MAHINVMRLTLQCPPPWDVPKNTQQHFRSSIAKSFTLCITTMHNLNFIVRKPGTFSYWVNFYRINSYHEKTRQTKELSSTHPKCRSHEKLGKKGTVKIGGDKGDATKCNVGL